MKNEEYDREKGVRVSYVQIGTVDHERCAASSFKGHRVQQKSNWNLRYLMVTYQNAHNA